MDLIYPNKTIKVNKIDYIFYFLVIIFLGSAMLLTRNSLEAFGGSDIITLFGKTCMLFYAIYLFHKHRYRFQTSIPWNIVLILFAWAILQVIKYHTVSAYFPIRLMNILFAVVIIKVYGTKSIYLFEYVVSKLSVISLFGWGLVLVLPDLMLELSKLSPIESYGLVKNGSFFIFGISDSYEIVRRNLGFAWEPGRFGSILSIGLFFNLIVYDFKLKKNRHFWYIVLAILSSQSTTAYIGLIFVLSFYVYNKKRKFLYKTLPIFIIGFLCLIQLDFMGEKIQSSWLTEEHAIEWNRQLNYYITQDNVVAPQRFDGLFYEFLNILHDPLIGNASDETSYLTSLFGIKFSLSNGCLRIFANMGIVMGILYYILLYKSSVHFSKIYQFKGKLAWFFLFILINISYSWIFEPVFLAIILLFLYHKPENFSTSQKQLIVQ